MTIDRRVVRCAIYTRKSSEEGLEQDFNSLDAQFEACGAYVTSQKHEGWKAQPSRYDDGGYSGGTLERPALKRLLVDIEAGRIDMVVVYKIDRLTRSLLDFGKLVELLDKARCSFVSVTQSFNTSTSMGRLTLNMLLSFAQFEREVTGERIRDKIAASKKKGMWMGGVPPLGYKAKERQLILEDKEAVVVRHIFDLYREHRCLVRTKRAADRLGLRGRPSTKYPEGPSFTRGGVYWLLTNPIYAGRIRHKDQTYPGQHEPLIDPAAWDGIQATLISQLGGRARGRPNACHPSPLAGRIVDETGERLTPSHAASGHGRRRYYVSKHLIEKNDEQASSGWRLPAVHVEQTVVSIVMDRLGAAGAATRATEGLPIVKVISDLDRRLKVLATTLSPAAALAFVEQVQIAQGQIDVQLGRLPIANALSLSPEMVAQAFLYCSRAFQMRRRGVEARLLLGDDPVMLDPALLKFVARAHVWWEQIRGGSTLGAIAKREGVTKRLIGLHLPAAFLAPDILQLIVDGRQPQSLTAQALRKHVIPSLWHDQRAMFGIANVTAKIGRTIPAA
jgi:DNA invertase Pin-like site-specific DNA recombinase